MNFMNIATFAKIVYLNFIEFSPQFQVKPDGLCNINSQNQMASNNKSRIQGLM